MNENKTLLDLAYEDLEVAKLAYESPKNLLRAAAYHIEQAIEKGLSFMLRKMELIMKKQSTLFL